MSRIADLAARLPEEADGALITGAVNRRYFTGFPSSAGTLLITRKAAVFLTDSRYIEAARRVVRDAECLTYSRLSAALGEQAERLGIHTLLVEDEGMTCAERRRVGAMLDAVKLLDGKLDALIGELRLIKSPRELESLRQAQALTDFGFDRIVREIRAGRTEREIALELEFIIRREGAEAAAFEFIVVSGANSSLPHGVPTDKPLAAGDFVTMDFGAVADGLHSDMTRTVAVGHCPDEQRAVYDTVLSAQQAALAALRAGISGQQGDAAARDVIAAAGWGEYFGHGTGHGVGMEVHEAPRLSPLAGDEPLPAGSVVTVEPGVYLPGRFGVRIEDMVALTDDGCENFTRSPKELLIVG